jgi:hypothetical protein
VAISATGVGPVEAEEGFLSRINPFRFFRNRTESKQAQVPSPANPIGLERRGIQAAKPNDFIARQTLMRGTEQHHYRFESGRPPTLEEIQSHLEARGVDSAAMGGNTSRLTVEQQNRHRFGQTGRYGTPPTLAEIRAELEARGIDPSIVDSRLARVNDTRYDNGRFSGQVDTNTSPGGQEIRTRLRRDGQEMNEVHARFGRSSREIGNQANPTSNRSRAGGVRRIRR